MAILTCDQNREWMARCLSKTTIRTALFLSLIISMIVLTDGRGHVSMGRSFRGQLRRDYISDRIMETISPQLHKIGTDAKKDERICPGNINTNITIGRWTQPLDQFDTTNKAEWKQHYQVNDKFFDPNATNPAIFLLIGGEAPIENKWVCNEGYTYIQLAKIYKARIIQLEHRFFGSNVGLPDLSTENLKYLTTEQALKDLYQFIQGYNRANKWTEPKWVIFGGSYPGTMAALFRLLYPKASQGAISSSSVLFPKVDLWQYADKMEEVIKETNIKTDLDCYNAIKSAFTTLQSNMYSDEGRAKVSTSLGLQTPLDDNLDNIRTVQFRLFDALQGLIQYTYDGRELKTQTGNDWTIRHVCEIMVDDQKIPDEITRLNAATYKLVNGDAEVFDPSYDSLISPWKDTDISNSDGYRGWLWLSCNEFGLLQSTSNNGMFGDAVPLSFLLKICEDIFDGLNASTIYDRVQGTLNRYGYPWNFRASNLFLPAGGYDPWSELRVNVSDEAIRMASHLTPRSAHCSDI